MSHSHRPGRDLRMPGPAVPAGQAPESCGRRDSRGVAGKATRRRPLLLVPLVSCRWAPARSALSATAVAARCPLRSGTFGNFRRALAAIFSPLVWLRGSVLESEALSGSAMDGYVIGQKGDACERGAGAPLGRVRGREEILRRPLPRLGCRYPTPAPSHTPLPWLPPAGSGREKEKPAWRPGSQGGGQWRRSPL